MRTNRAILLKTAKDLGVTDEGAFANEVQTKFNRIKTDCSNAITKINSDAVNDKLKKYFGSDDVTTKQSVKNALLKIKTQLEKIGDVNIQKASDNDDNVYAHVYPKKSGPNFFIYVNQRFKDEKLNDLDCKYLTLVHELSHLCAATEDYMYDEDIEWTAGDITTGNKGKCKASHTTDDYTPSLAVKNADSYGYFMADVIQ